MLFIRLIFLSAIALYCFPSHGFGKEQLTGLPLFYWNEDPMINFGDYLSRVLVERIVETPLHCYVKKSKYQKKKLHAIGSIFYFAATDDVVWGSGINGKTLNKEAYDFTHLDIRSVRGPLTRKFLQENFQIECPEIYGDPALLFPYLFPEFKKKENPSIDYLIIPHYTDQSVFPKSNYHNVVYTTDPWREVLEKILDSRFVIASSLHALVIAEAYGIPARAFRIADSEHNHAFKYYDYYLGTQRPNFQFASSVEEALLMGGEPPIRCDLQKLYDAFPFEFWPNIQRKPLKFLCP